MALPLDLEQRVTPVAIEILSAHTTIDYHSAVAA